MTEPMMTLSADASCVILASRWPWSTKMPPRPFFRCFVCAETSAHFTPSGAAFSSAMRWRAEDSTMPPMARNGSAKPSDNVPASLPRRADRRDRSWWTIILMI